MSAMCLMVLLLSKFRLLYARLGTTNMAETLLHCPNTPKNPFLVLAQQHFPVCQDTVASSIWSELLSSLPLTKVQLGCGKLTTNSPLHDHCTKYMRLKKELAFGL